MMEFVEDDICNACKAGDTNFLASFLKAGLDINFVFTSTKDTKVHGYTLLHIAVARQHVDLAAFLIRRGCDVNKAVQCLGGHGKTSKIKVKKHKNRLQWTVLFRAICMQDADMTRLLVQGGADVNIYDRSACTALWHAVDTNNAQITNIILNTAGCDVNLQDTFNMAPLHVAATHNNCNVILDLIQHNALVDIKQLQGATPLYLSSAYGDYKSVKLFLQHGANPNHQDQDGYTAIFAALDKGNNADVVYLLIQAGASVHSKRIFYAADHIPLLVNNANLCEYVKAHLDNAQSLRSLAALKIKHSLRQVTRGLSIYKTLAQLPLPKLIIEFLQLNKI